MPIDPALPVGIVDGQVDHTTHHNAIHTFLNTEAETEAGAQEKVDEAVTKVVIDALGIDAATLDGNTLAQIQTLIVAAITDSAPGTLDTLNELAAALGDDPNFVTTVMALIGAKQPSDADLTAIAGLDSSTAGAIASDGAGWIKKTYAQFKAALTLVKGDVGLGNVDNTSDANKPISDAAQEALDDLSNDKVDKATFDANTILKADSDNTPTALTVAASRIVGRKASGNIEALTAAEVQALLDTLPAQGCKVTRASAQSIPNSTVTAVAFTSEGWDSDGYHDNSTNNSRMTVPTGKGGKFVASACAVFASNATGRRVIRLMKNGVNIIGRTDTNAVSVAGVITTLNVKAEVALADTDYLEVQVFQDSGGSLDIATGNLVDSGGTSICAFGSIRRIGA